MDGVYASVPQLERSNTHMSYTPDRNSFLVDVREEDWYKRYLQSVSDTVNDIADKQHFKDNKGKIKVLGIEGDVAYSLRTRYEWTCLQADIDRGVELNIMRVRPQFTRIPFSQLKEELEWVKKEPRLCCIKMNTPRYIVVASCPGRIDEDRKVMEQVRELCSRYTNVRVAFSYEGNLASRIFSGRAKSNPLQPGAFVRIYSRERLKALKLEERTTKKSATERRTKSATHFGL